MVGIIIVQHFLTSVRTVIPSHAIYLVFSIYSFLSRNIHFYQGIFISIQEYSFLSRNFYQGIFIYNPGIFISIQEYSFLSRNFYQGIFISIQEYSFLSRNIHFYPEIYISIQKHFFHPKIPLPIKNISCAD